MGSLNQSETGVKTKPVSVNPLKTSPGMGAAVALQGIKGAVPVFHAGPGCTFLSKVVLTNHMREPVGLLGTDIKELTTILGGWELIQKKITETDTKQKPELIAVISTALSDVRGEDVEGAIASLDGKIRAEMIHISAPDFKGGYAEGFASAVEEAVKSLSEGGERIADQINIIPAAWMTPGDHEEIREIAESFGLKVILLPDLGSSMDGSKSTYTALPTGGTTLEEIKTMGRSAMTISLSEGMRAAGDHLETAFGVPHWILDGLTGLTVNDAFIKHLMDVSGKEPSERIRRHRRRLVDAMIDTHAFLYGRKIALALESDHILSLSHLISEMGLSVQTAVTTKTSRRLSKLSFRIRQGDLGDLEEGIREGMEREVPAEVIITNSHGHEISKRTGIPLYKCGYPVHESYGEPLKVRSGYRGTVNLIYEIANIIREHSAH